MNSTTILSSLLLLAALFAGCNQPTGDNNIRDGDADADTDADADSDSDSDSDSDADADKISATVATQTEVSADFYLDSAPACKNATVCDILVDEPNVYEIRAESTGVLYGYKEADIKASGTYPAIWGEGQWGYTGIAGHYNETDSTWSIDVTVDTDYDLVVVEVDGLPIAPCEMTGFNFAYDDGEVWVTGYVLPDFGEIFVDYGGDGGSYSKHYTRSE